MYVRIAGPSLEWHSRYDHNQFHVCISQACLSSPEYTWLAVQALADLDILPMDVEIEDTDRGSGLRLESDADMKILEFLSRQWKEHD